MPFDELNALAITATTFARLNEIAGSKKPKSLPIDRYFDEMDLPAADAKLRKEYAKRMEDILLICLALLFELLKRDAHGNASEVKRKLRDDLTKLAEEITSPDSYMQSYIAQYADRFIDSTVRKAQRYFKDEEDKLAYWFSEDRATYNAENEANTVLNYDEFRIAKEMGMTRKRWVTMKDERVRATHASVHGVEVPIDGFFQVGESIMRFPKDTEYCTDPEEIVACRCSVTYF